MRLRCWCWHTVVDDLSPSPSLCGEWSDEFAIAVATEDDDSGDSEDTGGEGDEFIVGCD